MARWISLVCSFIFFSAPAIGLCDAIKADKSLIKFLLPVPEREEQRNYLGISPGKSFELNQVKSDILIVEIFSMYCPICQREAANVNNLYELIQERSGPGLKILLIGIGAGNSAYEVNFFKENYSIKFPLFSDGDFTIHKKIGEKGTPYFMGFIPGTRTLDKTKADSNNNGLVPFFTHEGEIKDIEKFLDELIKASGMPG